MGDLVAERDGPGCLSSWKVETTGRVEMEANVGQTDRIIRIAAGILLLSLIFVGPRTWWGLVGVVPLVTAFVNFCPAYKLLGVDTRGK
jgi:hypothetical protein